MEEHWYLITDDKDNPIRTTDLNVVNEALRKKKYGVVEIKEYTMYTENSVAQISLHSQLKRPNSSPEKKLESK